MKSIIRFLILFCAIAVILFVMNRWVYPIEEYTCDSEQIKTMVRESISKEKVLKHLSLGEVVIERIYGIAEISNDGDKRICRAVIDTGSIFPGLEREDYKLKEIEINYAIKEEGDKVRLGSIFTDEGYNNLVSQVVEIYNNN